MTADSQLQAVSGFMAAAVAALGFAAPWPFVVTGALFAVAGGYAGMFVSPPEQRLGVWVTLGVALFIGLMAGMLHPHLAVLPWLGEWIAGWPIQLVMGAAGLASRWIAKKLVSGKLPKFEIGGGDDNAV